MASPAAIREFRYRVGTFNSTHSNAADASGMWNVYNSAVVKMAICEYDATGLEREALPDETLQFSFAFGSRRELAQLVEQPHPDVSQGHLFQVRDRNAGAVGQAL